jgi:hypothetical protein
MKKRVDNTIELGTFCLDKASEWSPYIMTTDNLAIKCSGPINHEAICEYIRLYGFTAEVFNYNNQQLAIRMERQ